MKWILLIFIIVVNVVLTSVVNHIQPVVFGLPFFLFWIFIWMVLTPFITLTIYVIEKKQS
ncbi:DUF3311 domain-containing protein [Alicyclobacillus dauci]|uniref:DUF3311 domain-containing protein n=1 Tax=Alicyclobacillus dauci TaxID=1475485 RepID=A0ABY6YYH6_9BACL|nr:DUF3311 domain-containing protein [Alicyclobacillus dauci]WAH35674.1 DUF3311 domain-containing protein [Alicyclobacillus dauci]